MIAPLLTVALVGLVLAVIVRWAVVGWQPIRTPEEPYDFQRDSIAGIGCEELGLDPADLQ